MNLGDRLSIGSLFTGVGGLELGIELAVPGAHPIWMCERAPFPRAVLEDRYPGVPIYRDVRQIDARAARPDLICGGFPCQDVSVAGNGAGISDGERSGLWWQFRRIVREVRPTAVFIENVFLGWRRWLPIVRRSLARIGYTSVPLRVSAADVGAPQERARVFVLAYADRLELRKLEQRMPGGRPGGIRHEGQALARGDIGAGCAWSFPLETKPFLLQSIAWHIEHRHPMVARDVARLARESHRRNSWDAPFVPRSAAGGAEVLALAAKRRTSW